MAEKNRTKDDYPKDSITLVKAGLLFVAVKLGDLLDEIVVVGGVVPSLLIDQEHAQEAHVGTTDLDLAFALTILDDERYRELAQRFRDAGFAPAQKPDGKIIRQTWQLVGKLGRITVDFLIPRSSKADPKRLMQNLESDLAAVRTRGLELAFLDRTPIDLEGVTIEGDHAKRTVNVAGVAAMLVLKAFAFVNRGAEKDAYDLFYLVRETGAEQVANTVAPYVTHPDVGEDVRAALENLKQDFTDPDGVGAGSVARFLGDDGNEDVRADVAGQVAAVLRRLSGH